MPKKVKNPPDSTLRNTRAANKRFAKIDARLDDIELRLAGSDAAKATAKAQTHTT